jgi:methyl-accepting chemotaxis protein
MKRASVRNWIGIWVCSCVLATAFIIAAYSAATMHRTVQENTVEKNMLLARYKAAAVEAQLDRVFAQTALLARVLAGIRNSADAMQADRSTVLGILRRCIADNPDISGAFTSWEMNGFDGRDSDFAGTRQYGAAGRFAVYMAGDAAGERPLPGHNLLAPGGMMGEWYEEARRSGDGLLIGPAVQTVDGGKILHAWAAAPIRSGNEFYGVIGLELNLAELQPVVAAAEGMDESARISVITHNGLLAGMTGSPELIGRHISELDGNIGQDASVTRENLSGAVPAAANTVSASTPVRVGRTATPWSVSVVFPESVHDTVAAGMIAKLAVITLVCVALSLALLRFMAGSIVNPLARVAELAGSLSAGDLTRRLEMKRNDEIGALADALDGSCVFLSRTIARVKENAEAQAAASQEMSSISAQMAAGAEQMSTQSETVAGATEQMSSSVNSMASAAEEMSVNIQSVSTTAEQMSTNMNSIASSMEQMATSIEEVAGSAKDGVKIAEQANAMSSETTATMDVLGQAAVEIGEVTNLIKRIAEQTNLLALNATIEAASAGDAGKGFAVVANEIKELANQSGQAAGSIAKKIQGMQENTESAVQSIQGIAEIIQKVHDASSVISRSVEEQISTSGEISESVQQASSGTGNIAVSIAELARGANDVSKSAAEAARAIQEVSANIQGMNLAARESSSGVSQVNQTAVELARTAVQLQTEMNRFKV